jgi:hypothetical protein
MAAPGPKTPNTPDLLKFIMQAQEQYGLFQKPVDPAPLQPLSIGGPQINSSNSSSMWNQQQPLPAGVNRPAPKDPTALMQIGERVTPYTPPPDNLVIPPSPPTKKDPYNYGHAALTGLSLIDSLIPEGKISHPVVKPQQAYNPTPYGTGSQALFKNGGRVKAENGLALDGGGDPPLSDKYGKYVKGREAWVDWTGKKLGKSTIKDITVQAAQAAKLRPSLLYASAMEEGMNLRVKSPDQVSEAYNNAKVDGAYPVDGFLNYGLDTFSDIYPNLVKKGYLKEDFKNSFIPYTAYNEKDAKVNTAAFRDDASALQAKAALIAYTRDNMLGYAKKNKIELSPEAQDFFTLAAYNGGEGLGQKMLQSYYKKGVLKDNAFLKTKPASYPGVYDNVMHRIQGANMLTGEGAFEMKNGGTLSIQEGKSYDLDTDTIKKLIDAGYELDFE